jgi:hypothetical protein
MPARRLLSAIVPSLVLLVLLVVVPPSQRVSSVALAATGDVVCPSPASNAEVQENGVYCATRATADAQSGNRGASQAQPYGLGCRVPLQDRENAQLSRGADGTLNGVSLGGTYYDEDETNCDTLVVGGSTGGHLTLYFVRNCLVSNFPGNDDYDPDKPIGALDICERGGPQGVQIWAEHRI